MIRVLQVFHGMDCGGAENMIMNLYRHIDRSKVQFDFLVHTKKKCFFDEEIKRLGGNIYFVPYYKVTNGKKYKNALNEFFSNHPEIKIVHGHLGSCAHIYLKIAKKYGCFAIAHSHNTKPKSMSVKNILYRLFTYRTRRIADYFFGCSAAAAEYRFGKKIANSDRCSILSNAIDLQKFAYSQNDRKDIRNEFHLDERFIIGHVGRFNPQKNHLFLIDVFYEIYKRNHNAVLMLLGEGFLKPSIEAKVEDLGLVNNVIFTGVRADVNRFLSAFDVFVFPLLYEGLPVTLIEAQANGVPIVCSDVITKEVNVSNRITYCSLTQTKPFWADCIESKGKERFSDVESLKLFGYDINESSKKLQKFYERLNMA